MSDIPQGLPTSQPGEIPGIAELYRQATRSFVDFVRTFDDDDWRVAVPCTPGWTARDVLSHQAGIPDDAFNGRMDGAPGEAWTAAQVERNASFGVDELLDRWMGHHEQFAELLEQIDQSAPPVDCHTHEHDLRHALGRPGNREHLIVGAMAATAAESLADAPAALRITFAGGRVVETGVGGPEVSLSIDEFEYFRSRLGRRSVRQLASYDWSGDPDAIAAVQRAWWIFGHAAEDIVE